MRSARVGHASEPVAGQVDSIQWADQRPIRRSGEIHPAPLLIHTIQVEDPQIGAGQRVDPGAITMVKVELAVTGALAEIDESFATVDPGEVVEVDVDPGVIAIGHDHSRFASSRIGQPELQSVLEPVQTDEPDLTGRTGEAHTRQIVISIGRRGFDPGRGAVGDPDDPETDPRVVGAGLRIADGLEGGIELRLVDEVERRNGALIETPECDAPAVGAPAQPIGEAQFLFVDPVGGPVDDVGTPVGCEGMLLAAGEIRDVDVMVANESDAPSVGRELGVALVAGGVAHGDQLARLEVPDVVARPGAASPDARDVGGDEQPGAIVRERVVLDGDGIGSAGLDQVGAANDQLSLPGTNANAIEIGVPLSIALHSGVVFAIVHPGEPDRGRTEVIRPVDRLRRELGDLAPSRCDAAEQQQQADGCSRVHRPLNGYGESRRPRTIGPEP